MALALLAGATGQTLLTLICALTGLGLLLVPVDSTADRRADQNATI
ncbi:hypothetical protein [Streptomyces sp. NPDC004629]